MYLVLQDRLVLKSPMGGSVVAYSQAFTMTNPDDALDLVVIIIAVTSANPGLGVTIEESDDDQNWSTNFFFGLPIAVGLITGPLTNLSAKRYRVKWEFGDTMGAAATCVLAANVDTHHD